MRTQRADCAFGPITFDWTDAYVRLGLDPGVDLITSSTWELTGSGSLGAESIATPETTVYVDGGTAGEVMVLENTIEIANGTARDCQKLYIEVV